MYNFLHLSLKVNALSKKAACSLADTSDATIETEKMQSKTVRSAMSEPLQLKAVWESLWEKYKKVYNIELSDSMKVAIWRPFSLSLFM